ncbi:transposase [Leptolyngbya boryana CZ1]|uniref:Transposase n=1 Tax=Leptolyngbya boryana CZ1 TaxID=3060204 RepID=A0AA96WQJ3_LEPBY|nr:transposase [Leptolyngbya boryana]WNZ44100.1 transposase [Leptolyngbya boryana CZ1]
MQLPHLYRELNDQFRQWIQPRDQRHLEGVSEAVATILQSESACLNHWLPYLSHRGCTARSHHARLNYLLTNPQVNAETFYAPFLQQVLQAWAGAEVLLTLDTSVLWDQFCWVGVCLVWGGRSFTLAQTVLEHASATVAFDAYLSVLEEAFKLLPPDCQVTLLADRGFEHGELIRWCNRHAWQWSIRAKSNLAITFVSGAVQSVAQLLPPVEQAYLFPNVTILDDISCHLATATLPGVQESWAVLSSQPPSLLTFERYGKRFGGIEPHIKDYKSAAFNIIPSHLRDTTALTRLFMLLDIATLIALILGNLLVRCGLRRTLDTHPERGLSFLQLGLRYLKQLRHLGRHLPCLEPLPHRSPPAACASASKRNRLSYRIQFSKVTMVSS